MTPPLPMPFRQALAARCDHARVLTEGLTSGYEGALGVFILEEQRQNDGGLAALVCRQCNRLRLGLSSEDDAS